MPPLYGPAKETPLMRPREGRRVLEEEECTQEPREVEIEERRVED